MKSDTRCRIDAARQVLDRVDELGEAAVVTYALALLIRAGEALREDK